MLELVAANRWSIVGEPEWLAIVAAIPGVQPDDLRAAGIVAEPPWCGVAQHTFGELQASLIALTDVYQARPALQRFCRVEVIRAKDRARVISRSPAVDAAKRQVKAEMVEWMLVWLGDPALFPAWAEVRQARMRRLSSPETGDATGTETSDAPPEVS